MAVWSEGPRTFLAGEALEAYRRVKIKSNTTTSPPEVVYADAGEACMGVTLAPAKSGEAVTVKALNDSGTTLVTAADSFAIGATLYGANDGKVSDSASGSAQFKALEAATADGDVIEAVVDPYLTSTAATQSIADAGDHFAAAEATVEAAIQKLAKTITLCFSAGTIATAASDAKIAEDFELPVPVRVKRAYATLATAPGSGKTLTVEIKVGAGADATLLTVADTATKAEAESLDIAIAANTDFDIQLTQDTGAAAGLNLMLVCQVDDGE